MEWGDMEQRGRATLEGKMGRAGYDHLRTGPTSHEAVQALHTE